MKLKSLCLELLFEILKFFYLFNSFSLKSRFPTGWIKVMKEFRACRSSHRRCSVKKGVLNTCARVSFLIKLQASACTPPGGCLMEHLQETALQNTSRRLLLSMEDIFQQKSRFYFYRSSRSEVFSKKICKIHLCQSQF